MFQAAKFEGGDQCGNFYVIISCDPQETNRDIYFKGGLEVLETSVVF